MGSLRFLISEVTPVSKTILVSAAPFWWEHIVQTDVNYKEHESYLGFLAILIIPKAL